MLAVGYAKKMKRCINLFIAIIFLLGIGAGYGNAGTYTSKVNPQHSVEYKTIPGIYLTLGQCKDCSQKNYPGTVVRCYTLHSRHFYLNGEIVDGRMDQIAADPGLQIAEGVFIFIIVLLLIVIALCVYMIPTFTAYKRQHPQRVYIMLLNLFLGNTLVGWIAALIWARGGGEDGNS